MYSQKKKEEFAIILDFFPFGDPSKEISEPTAYAIGEQFFTLLLLTIKSGVKVEALEEVYIGEGKRDKVKSVIKKISIKDLSLIAKENLEKAIIKIIEKNEKRFVDFFNNAGPLSLRVHSLELIPGIGKTILNRILEEREKEKFSSLEDIEKRIKGLKNIKYSICKRIISELEEKEKIKLFTV